MTTKFQVRIIIMILLSSNIQAQTTNQLSSPYSFFGLGKINDIGVGKTNALGRSGISYSSESEINTLNPASFAKINLNSFLFDVGARAQQTELKSNRDQKDLKTFNFSNLAFAFALDDKSGIGFSIVPFSEANYYLYGIETPVEGSNEGFFSNVSGNGGISNLKISYGRSLNKKLRVGLDFNYYFGTINENEIVNLGTDFMNIDKKSFYRGIRPILGLQYDYNPKINFSAVLALPSYLKGTRDTEVSKIIDLSQYSIESSVDKDITGFKLPTEITLGFKFQPLKTLSLNVDYRKSFWSATGIEDNIGKFEDQDFIGFGAEYYTDKGIDNFWKKIRYRLGYNFDNGYLAVNGNKIENFLLTSGLGIPLNTKSQNFINISYAYGQRGVISNVLIKENYHFITLNLSFEDFWFVKKKYN